MTIDTRVGHGATSVLEEEVRQYIIAFTYDGLYHGDPHYLRVYQELHTYNTEGEDAIQRR